MVTIRERAEGGSALFFTLMDTPNRAQWARRHHEPMLQQVMPPLMAPRGASLSAEGGGGSDTSWRTYARMSVAFAPEAVVAHFDKQLESAGWQRLAGGATGEVGWSLWSVAVETQSVIGAFVALRLPARQDTLIEYLLEARLEASERQQPRGGWTSYAPMVSGGGPSRPR